MQTLWNCSFKLGQRPTRLITVERQQYNLVPLWVSQLCVCLCAHVSVSTYVCLPCRPTCMCAYYKQLLLYGWPAVLHQTPWAREGPKTWSFPRLLPVSAHDHLQPTPSQGTETSRTNQAKIADIKWNNSQPERARFGLHNSNTLHDIPKAGIMMQTTIGHTSVGV